MQSDPAALGKLKEINEAYEVLSDEQKRRDYDRRSGKSRRPVPVSAQASDFRPVPKQVKPPSRHNQQASNISARACDIEMELPITPEEARYGGPCEFVMVLRRECERCGGHGRRGNTDACCDGCCGSGQINEQRRLRLSLPRGLRTGTVLYIGGQRPRRATAAGDLVLRIKVLPYW